MSITEHSALDVSRDSTSTNSSDQARTVIMNLAYPTRPTCYAPWASPPKPLIIKPTVCTRYDATLVYSNGTSGLAGHNYQSSVSTSSFESDTLRWIKRVFSRHVCKLRRKVELAKARLSVSLLRSRN
ncbi:hypothetical protein BJ912DRAFT_1064932 [Pholiota molesta]|nr:hypothetical protein BJ912DRAFT_1064932 [Pholiota molesta]